MLWESETISLMSTMFSCLREIMEQNSRSALKGNPSFEFSCLYLFMATGVFVLASVALSIIQIWYMFKMCMTKKIEMWLYSEYFQKKMWFKKKKVVSNLQIKEMR